MLAVSVSLSVTRLKSAAVRALYAVCHVGRVIRYSLCQMLLASCYYTVALLMRIKIIIVYHFFRSCLKIPFLGCIECMICRLLLPMFAVSVRLSSVCHKCIPK